MSDNSGTDQQLSPAQILRWYVDMGVDLAVDDAAHDRFAESLVAEVAALVLPAAERQQPALPPRKLPNPVQAVQKLADAGPQAASNLAAAAQNMDQLRAALLDFDGSVLKKTATQLVFADGVAGTRLMLVGDAPSADEDRQGHPFAGKAGRLLDAMLASIGLDRTKVYLANVVPWRPPGNLVPTRREIGNFLPFITRQIELAEPDLLVCFGGVAVEALLGVDSGIMRARGNWYECKAGARTIPALAMYPLDMLLKQPALKKQAWKDLLELKKRLEGPDAQAS